jgi:hypothetical protein
MGTLEEVESFMELLKNLPSHTYTRLHARITQEEGAFTVSVRMFDHLKLDEKAWGEEIATSIDMASLMIDAIAKQFCISQNCISVSIVMNNFKDGTFH